MTTKNTETTGIAAWQLFSPRVASGIALSGSTIKVATVGNRLNTGSGNAAADAIQLVRAGVSAMGSGVSEAGALGGLRHESEPALDRGKLNGGFDQASHETPRWYGALGECPRKIPA